MKRHWIGLILWFWLFHAWFGSDAVGGTLFEPQINAFGTLTQLVARSFVSPDPESHASLFFSDGGGPW